MPVTMQLNMRRQNKRRRVHLARTTECTEHTDGPEGVLLDWITVLRSVTQR